MGCKFDPEILVNIDPGKGYDGNQPHLGQLDSYRKKYINTKGFI